MITLKPHLVLPGDNWEQCFVQGVPATPGCPSCDLGYLQQSRFNYPVLDLITRFSRFNYPEQWCRRALVLGAFIPSAAGCVMARRSRGTGDTQGSFPSLPACVDAVLSWPFQAEKPDPSLEAVPVVAHCSPCFGGRAAVLSNAGYQHRFI